MGRVWKEKSEEKNNNLIAHCAHWIFKWFLTAKPNWSQVFVFRIHTNLILRIDWERRIVLYWENNRKQFYFYEMCMSTLMITKSLQCPMPNAQFEFVNNYMYTTRLRTTGIIFNSKIHIATDLSSEQWTRFNLIINNDDSKFGESVECWGPSLSSQPITKCGIFPSA